MTAGQERAVSELRSLHVADPDGFQIVGLPAEVNSWVKAVISLKIGVIETADGGLDLRDREEFTLHIPPDFPFDYPSLTVSHSRFASFPHVVWSKNLCLYQSKIEWNPSDGLYGFFDRLKLWLGRAAVNDMDPIEGPLEPPHHNTDFSQLPFVIRSNAPVAAGESWLGVAELKKHPNRVELVGWNDLSGAVPENFHLALAAILSEPLPMEFPSKGADLFEAFTHRGIDGDRILRYLALAALITPEGEPIHLVLGLPMRRAADGTGRLHIAVWTTDAKYGKSLRAVVPKDTDDELLKTLRQDVSDALRAVFERMPIKWCRVFEDRGEIIVRRDSGRPLSWLNGKRVLVLGCGALGSWAAEIIARASPSHIDLVDNSLVKPGLLTRQNFTLSDIASPKPIALANRINSIASNVTVGSSNSDAHTYLFADLDRLNSYDIICDFTANSIFHMKLERDWLDLKGRSPLVLSFAIDAEARRILCVVLDRNSVGGIWDGYVRLKQRLCVEVYRTDFTTAFYSNNATQNLFQPEPGCSDPTFIGSTADVTNLLSAALNLALGQKPTRESPIGIVLSAPQQSGLAGALDIRSLPPIDEFRVTRYRVRISRKVYAEARSWVHHNNRIRSSQFETGGLLWGMWDDAANVIWIFDLSGPPPDSVHKPSYFVCGAEGTIEEHRKRVSDSYGVVGFIGFWHTHPAMTSQQSHDDMVTMAELVARIRGNQRRAMMLIFGQSGDGGMANINIYESQSSGATVELLSVGVAEIKLDQTVL